MRVTLIEPDGRRRYCVGYPGQSLMDVALVEGVEGILGQCGGAMNCATCLCALPPYWLERLPQPHPDERELLSYVDQAGPRSRLGCQVLLRRTLDGLVARVTPSTPASGLRD
ncbi:MAG: hypothetical protein AAF515_13725 [Pseudomonadota bacterium]